MLDRSYKVLFSFYGTGGGACSLNRSPIAGQTRSLRIRSSFRPSPPRDQNRRKSGWLSCQKVSTTLPMMLEPSIGPQYLLSHESARLSPST